MREAKHMTIHSCSYYCHQPECIKAQRDELRDKLYQRTWVSLTADEVTIIEHEVYGRTVQKGKPMSVFITQFAKAIDSALKGKNHHA